jgi:hypothetical protein
MKKISVLLLLTTLFLVGCSSPAEDPAAEAQQENLEQANEAIQAIADGENPIQNETPGFNLNQDQVPTTEDYEQLAKIVDSRKINDCKKLDLENLQERCEQEITTYLEQE